MTLLNICWNGLVAKTSFSPFAGYCGVQHRILDIKKSMKKLTKGPRTLCALSRVTQDTAGTGWQVTGFAHLLFSLHSSLPLPPSLSLSHNPPTWLSVAHDPSLYDPSFRVTTRFNFNVFYTRGLPRLHLYKIHICLSSYESVAPFLLVFVPFYVILILCGIRRLCYALILSWLGLVGK